jgi:hypothetical protein
MQSASFYRSATRPLAVAGLLALFGAPAANAAPVSVASGQTSVALDAATLQSAANLAVSGTSGGVIAPGDLPGSVAFPITPATTFRYDPADFLNTFSGTIEHEGSVLFNDYAIEAGDFTIAYNATRAGTLGGAASGFYVRSNAGLEEVLFDIGAPDALSATDSDLAINADLLVSPEFAALLQSIGLAAADLSGADVGDARVAAAVTAVPLPAPALAGLIGLAGIAGARTLRRKTRM